MISRRRQAHRGLGQGRGSLLLGMTLGALALMAAAGPAAAGPAAAQPLRVVFLTTARGAIGALTEQMAADLTARGAQVEFSTEFPPDLPPEAVVVLGDEQAADQPMREATLTFLRGGGGGVLLVEPSARRFDQANLLLREVGAAVVLPAAAPEPLRLGDTALTAGLSFAAPQQVRMELTGQRLTPVATAGGRAVIGLLPVEAGRLAVLPAALILSGLRADPSDPTGVTLAARAALWAGGHLQVRTARDRADPSVPDFGRYLAPQADLRLPLESSDFAGAVLWDSQAADEQWPQIHARVLNVVEGLGLPIRVLRVGPFGAPLAEALRSDPALVVLGTWRELAESEAVALHYYLLGGGRVLALAHADTRSQIRLVHTNQALYPHGVLFSLGRPGAEAQIAPSPLREGLPDPGRLPGGILIFGPAARPVVAVRGYAAVALAESGPGRLLLLDARPLADNNEYAGVLREGMRWLTATTP